MHYNCVFREGPLTCLYLPVCKPLSNYTSLYKGHLSTEPRSLGPLSALYVQVSVNIGLHACMLKYLSYLFQFGEHHNDRTFLVPNHLPEVRNCIWSGT